MIRSTRMTPERITITDPCGDKWVVSIEPRGMPEAVRTSGAWIIGWFVAGVFFSNQYKIIVRQFHPKRTKAPRLYDTTYWSLKGYRSYEAAETAAKSFVQQIMAGTWAGGAA